MPEEIDTATFCPECKRLLEEYLSVARETRISLEAVVHAKEAGVLDELNSLAADVQVENALDYLSQAQQAYGRHRRERHRGSPALCWVVSR